MLTSSTRGVTPIALGLALAAVGCGADLAPSVPDAAMERTGTKDPDGGFPGVDASNRLTMHDGDVVPSLALGVLYVGDASEGGPPSMDADLAWLVGSGYWGLLAEYGIEPGTVVASVRLPVAAFFQAADVSTGIVDVAVMQTRVFQALHGVDGGPPAASFPGANAVIVLLPDGVNVALGHRGNYTYQTCIDANGYHGHDGQEPYVVLPPCDAGRSTLAASHELSELVTDPSPFRGWASDVDIPTNGGEVADLCAQSNGVAWDAGAMGAPTVAQLWSDQHAQCVPLK